MPAPIRVGPCFPPPCCLHEKGPLPCPTRAQLGPPGVPSPCAAPGGGGEAFGRCGGLWGGGMKGGRGRCLFKQLPDVSKRLEKPVCARACCAGPGSRRHFSYSWRNPKNAPAREALRSPRPPAPAGGPGKRGGTGGWRGDGGGCGVSRAPQRRTRTPRSARPSLLCVGDGGDTGGFGLERSGVEAPVPWRWHRGHRSWG